MNQTLSLAVNSGVPPRRAVNDGYYGDRYSDPVWLATGWPAAWDFRNDGWVAPGLHGGPSPSDYDHLPKGAKAKKVQWVMMPPRQGTESKPGLSFTAQTSAALKRKIPIPHNQRPENIPAMPAKGTTVYHTIHGNGVVQFAEDGEVLISFPTGSKNIVWALAWDHTYLHMEGIRLSEREADLGNGDRIIHDIFGHGVVSSCAETKSGKPKSVTAEFDRHGTQTMMWSFCAGKIVRLRKAGKKP